MSKADTGNLISYKFLSSCQFSPLLPLPATPALSVLPPPRRKKDSLSARVPTQRNNAQCSQPVEQTEDSNPKPGRRTRKTVKTLPVFVDTRLFFNTGVSICYYMLSDDLFTY